MPAPRPSESLSQRAREERNLDGSSDEDMESEDEPRMVSDKQQSPNSKRRVRAEYRRMQAQADELRDTVSSLKVQHLQEVVASTNSLFSNKVFSAGEATLDSRLLFTHTDTASRIADMMKTNANAFDMDEFLLRAKQKLGLEQNGNAHDDDDNARRGGQGDWESLGWLAARFSKRSTGVEFMYGPLSVGYKKRVVSKRAKRQADAPEIRPEEVHVSTKDAESETVAFGKVILQLLRKLAKQSDDPPNFEINLFKFVVNPNSYCQTVENLFFLSFLVRDSYAVVEWNEKEGVHVIRLPRPQDGDPATLGKNQEVFSLTMDVINDAIEIFDIRESMIPDRPGLPESARGPLFH